MLEAATNKILIMVSTTAEVFASPETPVMVMKGHVAHWSGFQEEVGSVMAGTDTAGFTMLTGSTGTGREMSPPPLRADTED